MLRELELKRVMRMEEALGDGERVPDMRDDLQPSETYHLSITMDDDLGETDRRYETLEREDTTLYV